jgi:hypothetical protein
LLLLTFAILECAFVRDFGYKAIVPVALGLGLPTCALAGGYVYVAYVRAKWPPRYRG